MSGQGITPSTFTSAISNDVWQKFTLTGTPTSTGNLTITIVGNSSNTTTSAYYFDGVINAPYTLDSRHYGYIFDANAYRTVNPYINQTNEATV